MTAEIEAPMNIFVTAIDTDSGKTLVSAILCEALQADYWKPVQAGLPRDSEKVSELVTNSHIVIHRERYQLNMAASPHAAAKADGVEIHSSDFTLPETKRSLIIEGAGGCLVPINDQEFVIDLASRFKAEIILVADLYLGSINHTLLTAEALMRRGLAPMGIIFNGDSNQESERIIRHHTGLEVLLHIAREKEINNQTVTRYAALFNNNRRK